jgi:hypothetical protein
MSLVRMVTFVKNDRYIEANSKCINARTRISHDSDVVTSSNSASNTSETISDD